MKGLALIVRYILIILLAIIILAFAIVNISSSTILSKDYALSKLEETEYYSGIYQEIEKNFKNYIDQSGLEEEVMNNVITEDKVKNDVNIMISNIYDGKNEEIDVAEIKTNLNNNIDEYISKQQGVKADKDAIEKYIDKICEQYKSTMTHTDYEQQINNAYMKIMKYINLGNKGILIAMLVLIIVIFALCHNRLFKGISSVGISILSSGVFLTIANIFVNTNVKINTITILNGPITKSLRLILNDIMSVIAKYGYWMLAIGIVLIILGNLMDSIKYKEEE